MRIILLFLISCGLANATDNEITVSPRTGVTYSQFVTELNSIGCSYTDSALIRGTTDIYINAKCPNFTFIDNGVTLHIKDYADDPNATLAQLNAVENAVDVWINNTNYINPVLVNTAIVNDSYESPRPGWATTANNPSFVGDGMLGVPSPYWPQTMVIDKAPVYFSPNLVGHIEWAEGETAISYEEQIRRTSPGFDYHATQAAYVGNQVFAQNMLYRQNYSPTSLADSITSAIESKVKVISMALGGPSFTWQHEETKQMERAFNAGIVPIVSFGNGTGSADFALGPLNNFRGDTAKILTVTSHHIGPDGKPVKNFFGGCALPGQEPPDISLDSSNIPFGDSSNAGFSSSSSASASLMRGYAAEMVYKFPYATQYDVMNAATHSTRMKSGNTKKDPCFGWGPYDHGQAMKYMKYNDPAPYPQAPTLRLDGTYPAEIIYKWAISGYETLFPHTSSPSGSCSTINEKLSAQINADTYWCYNPQRNDIPLIYNYDIFKTHKVSEYGCPYGGTLSGTNCLNYPTYYTNSIGSVSTGSPDSMIYGMIDACYTAGGRPVDDLHGTIRCDANPSTTAIEPINVPVYFDPNAPASLYPDGRFRSTLGNNLY